MSAKVNNALIERFLVYDYETEWEISDLSSLGNKSLKTPIFSPICNLDCAFFFEIWYAVITNPQVKGDKTSTFNMRLVKHYGFEVSPTMKLTGNVTINYSTGDLFKQYKLTSPIVVEQMDALNFDGVVSKLTRENDCYLKTYTATDHGTKMNSDKLTIRCQLEFRDHPYSSKKHFKELSALSIYQESGKDLRTVYTNNVLSDVVFKIGDKTLTAHKVILIAHSPVFMKMLMGDYIESKNNPVNITDFSHEEFDWFLTYLYSGKIVDNSWPSLKVLYVLADKYDVKTLKRNCIIAIVGCLSTEYVCDILSLAYKFNDSDLKEPAKIFAAQNIECLNCEEEWIRLVSSSFQIGYDVMTTVTELIKKC